MNSVITTPEDAADHSEPLMTYHDCGHFHPYGICPKCGRGHGWKIHQMKTKSTAQIQAEIELMRLAYQDKLREAQPTRPHPLFIALPYLISAAVALLIIAVLVGIFLERGL